MLIEDYDLEVESVPCEPRAEEFAAIVRLSVDISPALPYLNRALRGARYIAQAPSLTWKKGGRNIAFWSYKIAIGHLEDRARAEKVAQGLVDLVNRTWERRGEIEPDYEMHKRPGPLEVDKLLPQTIRGMPCTVLYRTVRRPYRHLRCPSPHLRTTATLVYTLPHKPDPYPRHPWGTSDDRDRHPTWRRLRLPVGMRHPPGPQLLLRSRALQPRPFRPASSWRTST